ncbi:MAG TPA: hypothetical protein VF005_03825, partial [Acidimicrobiales bacterium]
FSDLFFAILALFIGYLPGGSLAGMVMQLAARVREPRGLTAALARAAATGALAPRTPAPLGAAGNGARPPVSLGPVSTNGAEGDEALVASPFADRVLRDEAG